MTGLPPFSTVFAKSSTALLKHVQSIPIPERSLALFSISQNVAPPHLSAIVSHFGKHNKSLGCITQTSPVERNLVYCSIGLFSQSASVVPFRSTIPGRAKIALGRWQRLSDQASPPPPLSAEIPSLESINDLWNNDSKENAVSRALPQELANIRESIKGMVYMSDGAPEGITASLDAHLPSVPKLGLIGASTPFVTGHEHTLIQGLKVYGNGAIGLAFLDDRPASNHGFSSLTPISPLYTITSVASNLIYTIDGKNPTKEALTAYNTTEAVPLGKSIDMYLGVLSEGETNYTGAGGPHSVYDRVYRITSGDPKRGTLALDADEGPAKGAKVQFLRLRQTAPVSSEALTRDRPGIRFGVASDHNEESKASANDVEDRPSNDVRVLHDAFLAYSENGILISSSAGGAASTWRCSVPDGWGSFTWKV